APGCTVVTTTVGKSTFGKRSTPSSVNANAPTTVSERMSTVAKTGRLTQSAASHCMVNLYLTDRDAIGELAEIFRGHALAGLHAFGELDEIADRLAGRDDPVFRLVSIHDVDAAGAAGGHHGVRGHEHAGRHLALLDPRRREEARLQLARRVRHDGL